MGKTSEEFFHIIRGAGVNFVAMVPSGNLVIETFGIPTWPGVMRIPVPPPGSLMMLVRIYLGRFDPSPYSNGASDISLLQIGTWWATTCRMTDISSTPALTV